MLQRESRWAYNRPPHATCAYRHKVSECSRPLPQRSISCAQPPLFFSYHYGSDAPTLDHCAQLPALNPLRPTTLAFIRFLRAFAHNYIRRARGLDRAAPKSISSAV